MPFPINEDVIGNLESGMIMPTSSKYFYNFLRFELQDEISLTLFAVYADLRRFGALCAEGVAENERHDLAVKIFEDFITVNN